MSPTPAKSGASSPATTTSSAEPPPASGSITPSKPSSASRSASPKTTAAKSTRPSTAPSKLPPSSPAPSTSASASRSSPPPTPCSTRSNNTRPSRPPAGTARIIPTFRPDSVIDAQFFGDQHAAFRDNLDKLGEITGEDTSGYKGYLNALRNRRAFFKHHGATATDHGHLTARTADLGPEEAADLYTRIYTGTFSPEDVTLFQAQMLTEMAGMSIEDGLTMQIHPGSIRNHNAAVFAKFGRDKGADIPAPTDYVQGLRPLLNKYGNDPRLTLILFTLDETTYSRELAPLAGHYPALKLGPPWWFHDSPEGMMRFREQATETAGFYNTVGFNDDTRAFLSIPARHDVARRVDSAFLARLVAEHRLDESEAFELIEDLTINLVRRAYKL